MDGNSPPFDVVRSAETSSYSLPVVLKINFLAFVLSWFLYVYYSFFKIFRNRIFVLYRKFIPMFVIVVSVRTDHEHRDDTGTECDWPRGRDTCFRPSVRYRLCLCTSCGPVCSSSSTVCVCLTRLSLHCRADGPSPSHEFISC